MSFSNYKSYDVVVQRLLILSFILIITVTTGLDLDVQSEENIVPGWIKNAAEFWVDGSICDSEFIGALQFMISNGIIQDNIC